MASVNDNPYKRMKKALKGAKPSGDMVHKMAIKSVKMFGKPKKKVSVNTEMAMKKKSSTSMKGNKEMKASKKGVTGMKGNIKRKALPGALQPYSAAGPNGSSLVARANMGSKQPVTFSNMSGWNTSAGTPLKKKSKAKKKSA